MSGRGFGNPRDRGLMDGEFATLARTVCLIGCFLRRSIARFLPGSDH